MPDPETTSRRSWLERLDLPALALLAWASVFGVLYTRMVLATKAPGVLGWIRQTLGL